MNYLKFINLLQKMRRLIHNRIVKLNNIGFVLFYFGVAFARKAAKII